MSTTDLVENPAAQAQPATTHGFDFDVIGIGAGFAGLALIHNLREAGMSVRVFDKASDVGGTWTWNRYPGAATDSESYYYCLAFSKEILDEWSWSKRYAGWEETQRYLRFVADKCDLWPNIQLNTEIVEAKYLSDRGGWQVTTRGGETYTSKYLVSAMGMISEPMIPTIPGMERFKGPLFHSARWPQEEFDYAGKRIAIIGSGATTVQMLPVVAETAGSVTVFQRTPNYILPAMQKPMTPDWEKEIKANYDAVIAKCRNHVFGMAFDSPVGRNAMDCTPEERERIFEENWTGSFRWVFETFDDLLVNPEANRLAGDFIVRKMKERVRDPEIAEMLSPSFDDYPLFAKRPPLDHGYFEAFNRDNVQLVDIGKREPLVEITDTGIRTEKGHYEFDIIVLATGFKAYTGALEAFPIRGETGESLAEKWKEGRAAGCPVALITPSIRRLCALSGHESASADMSASRQSRPRGGSDEGSGCRRSIPPQRMFPLRRKRTLAER